MHNLDVSHLWFTVEFTFLWESNAAADPRGGGVQMVMWAMGRADKALCAYLFFTSCCVVQFLTGLWLEGGDHWPGESHGENDLVRQWCSVFKSLLRKDHEVGSIFLLKECDKGWRKKEGLLSDEATLRSFPWVANRSLCMILNFTGLCVKQWFLEYSVCQNHLQSSLSHTLLTLSFLTFAV